MKISATESWTLPSLHILSTSQHCKGGSRSHAFGSTSVHGRRSSAICASNRRSALLSATSFTLASFSPELEPTTVLNSVLGAFGLPKVKETSKKISYEDINSGIHLEYPASRKNTLRPGVYFSNFDSGDRAVLEIFSDDEARAVEQQLVAHFINPGDEGGGDSRLMTPPANRIKSATETNSNQSYTYVDFPSETVTRSGYQINQKNFGVAAKKKGMVYTLVASARTDKYDKSKEELLRQVIQSFRLEK